MTETANQIDNHCPNYSTLQRRKFLLVLIIIFIVALAIRLHNLDRESLWLDEVLQLRCATGPFAEIWSCSSGDKPPLDYYVQWLFVRGGADEFHARLHACLLGAAVVVAMGLWGKIMGGWSLALIAMCLSLAHPLLVRFSQEGRPYALMLVAECLFFAAFWSIARTSTAPEAGQPGSNRITHSPRLSKISQHRSWINWVALASALALCLWSLYWAALACALSALFAGMWWLSRGKRISEVRASKKQWAVPLICIGAALLTGVPLYFRAKVAVGGTFYAPFDSGSWSWSGLYLDIFALGYEWTQYTRGARWAVIILASVGWLGWASNRRRALSAQAGLQAHFCAFMFMATFFGVFLLYSVLDHWMELRYVLTALPPLILLAAMGIESVSRAVALLFRLIGLKSDSASRVTFGATVALLSLAAAALSLHYVWSDPMKRLDWRGLCLRLKSESTEATAVLLGAKGDEEVVRHYFERFGIAVPLIVANYDVARLNDALAAHKDLWIVVRPEARIPEEFRQSLKTLSPEVPSFWRLDVRRSLPALALAEKRPQLRAAALGHATREIIIYAGRQDCPFLGNGWGPPETWGKQTVRGLDGAFAEVFVPVSEPKHTIVSFSAFPYLPDAQPSLSLQLKINTAMLDSKPVATGWNALSWEIDSPLLHPGLNVLQIIPNRTTRPSDIFPNNPDTRDLSIWVEHIRITARAPQVRQAPIPSTAR